MATLTFLGAARTVTGSKYLLEHDGKRVLFDCGLFQGLKELRLRNWDAVPGAAGVDRRRGPDPRAPRSRRLAAAAGRAGLHGPRLLHRRHRGSVPAGAARPGRIQEEDARQANKHGYSKHHPALPLYTESDAQRALTHLQPVGYHRPIEVVPGHHDRVRTAGHLLGSSYVRGAARAVARRFCSAAISAATAGRCCPIPTTRSRPTSCWSNRPTAIAIIATDDDGERAGAVIRDTAARGGKLIIPAFAIGRVEELLYWLRRLEQRAPHPGAAGLRRQPDGRSRRCSSTPRARRARPGHAAARSKDVVDVRHRALPDDRLAAAVEGADRQPAQRPSSSRRAAWPPAAACCITWPRALPDPRNTVLFVGYQAAGTRGRQLVDGAAEVQDPRPARAGARARSRRSTRCRRTPIAARSCGGWARFRRAPGTAVPRARRAGPDGCAEGASIEQTSWAGTRAHRRIGESRRTALGVGRCQ